jgi:transcriptional regulator
VGFEVEITRLEGKWKMGQNRSEGDRRGAMEGLRGVGEEGVVREMERLGKGNDE